MSEPMVCAKCGEPDGLYEHVSVEGWQGIEVEMGDDGKPTSTTTGDRDVDWGYTESNGYGCSCGADFYPLAKGVKSALVDCARCHGAGCPRCGYDGRVDPTEPTVHPGQTRIKVAA